MTVERHDHYCPSCDHDRDSIEALQARLDRLEAAKASDDVTLQAWRNCFNAVCCAVAEVTDLDVHAVTSILEGLIVMGGGAQAKGAAIRNGTIAVTRGPNLRIVPP